MNHETMMMTKGSMIRLSADQLSYHLVEDESDDLTFKVQESKSVLRGRARLLVLGPVGFSLVKCFL